MKSIFRRATNALLVLACVGAALAQTAVSVLPGWNQLGNGYHTQIDVASTFGNAANVGSIWKWLPATGKWAYYDPQQADGGAAYAASLGLDTLTSINDGEGYWINANQGFNFSQPSGVAVATSEYKSGGALALSAGWNQVSIGYAKTASGFNNALSDATPAPGTTALSVQSIWAWDTATSKWYFYSPSLDAQGATVLSDYIAANGYLSFGTTNKILDGKTGFFVTKATGDITPPPTPQSVLATTTTTTTLAPTTTTTTSTTTAAPTTTTVAATTTTSRAPSTPLDFVQGWNLVGNGTNAMIDVATTFADTNKFVSVWKWIAAQSAWGFNAPTLAAQGSTVLADYAALKGYQLLTTIASGEGFWVNAKQAGSVNVTNGNVIGIPALGSTLVKGWNLVSVGESASPKQFCDAQTGGVTTLWAWEASGSAWYFYAPSLDANGGLAAYIASKGYLDFTARGKTLGPGVGFWVNKP